MPTIELQLDVAKPQSSIPIIHVRQGDTATVVRAVITDNGAPYDFSGNYLELAFIRPDGEWVHLKDACSQVQANTWDCTLPFPATAKKGLADLCYFVVRDSETADFRDSTNRFFMDFDPSATADADLGPYSDQLDAIIRQATLLTDAWEKQMQAQDAAFKAAQDERAEQFKKFMSQIDAQFKAAETTRKKQFTEAENKRQQMFEAAEAERDTQQAKNNADQALNNQAAQANTFTVLLEGGQYDPATGKPTIDGEPGKLYFTPNPQVETDNAYMEWRYLAKSDGSHVWESVGATNHRLPESVGTGNIDKIFAGQSLSGDKVMKEPDISYYYTKSKAETTGMISNQVTPQIQSAQTQIEALGKQIQTLEQTVSSISTSTTIKLGKYSGYKPDNITTETIHRFGPLCFMHTTEETDGNLSSADLPAGFTSASGQMMRVMRSNIGGDNYVRRGSEFGFRAPNEYLSTVFWFCPSDS